jgi:hypothetical protein
MRLKASNRDLEEEDETVVWCFLETNEHISKMESTCKIEDGTDEQFIVLCDGGGWRWLRRQWLEVVAKAVVGGGCDEGSYEYGGWWWLIYLNFIESESTPP